ncbi:MAG: hypothetical protein J6T91_01855 [Alphaproteobacteria bacterium]|nr:hypothetical protein [Alphaproteobacteria bacterium]
MVGFNMKYAVVSMTVLGCVFFESECGGGFLGRISEEAKRAEKNIMRPVAENLKKATRNVAQVSEREIQNFIEGTIQPATENVVKAYDNHVWPKLKRAEQNISENNDRLKSWFHGEAQPKVKEWYYGAFLKEIERIERSIRDLGDRVLRGETEGVDKTIQEIRGNINELRNDESRGSTQNRLNVHTEKGPGKAEVEEELSAAKKELEMARNRLSRAKLNKEYKLAEAEKADIELSKIDKYKLEIDILDEEYNVQVKELEVSRLESELKNIAEQPSAEENRAGTADDNVIRSVSDLNNGCVQQ